MAGDFHSGDDLGPDTRHAIRRATQGQLHFKILPSLQLLFAEVLQDFDSALFRHWYDDAVAYARQEAETGSDFAARCLRGAQKPDSVLSPYDDVFHHYSFAFVGRRNAEGQFLNREFFYDLSPSFYREYQARVSVHLCRLAEELL